MGQALKLQNGWHIRHIGAGTASRLGLRLGKAQAPRYRVHDCCLAVLVELARGVSLTLRFKLTIGKIPEMLLLNALCIGSSSRCTTL